MQAIRSPTSTAQWLKAREQDRRKRDAEAAELADDRPVVATPDPVSLTPPPTILTLEERRALAKRRERMAKATKSKVRADQLDKINAKKHADKVIAKMQREGRL